MENKVINVQMDKETFKKFQSGGGKVVVLLSIWM